MSEPRTESKNEFDRSVDLMRTLRDEVRVKLHLAGMDARDEWNRLEPRLVELERTADKYADKYTAATEVAIRDAIASLKKLRDAIVR
jgi:hypothetical protein